MLEIKAKEVKGKATRGSCKLEKSVAKWFDVDGILAEDIFQEDVEKLLNDFESGAGSISD